MKITVEQQAKTFIAYADSDHANNEHGATGYEASLKLQLRLTRELARDLVTALHKEARASESIARRYRRSALGPFDTTYDVLARACKELGLELILSKRGGRV